MLRLLKQKRPFFLILAVLLLSVGGLLARAQQEGQPLYALPSARVYTGSTMALTADGRMIIAANMLNNTITFAQPVQGQVLAEIPVGRDPRSIALTTDNTRALVVNRGDGTLSVVDIAQQLVIGTLPVGTLPYAVVTDNDENAYVSLQGSSEVVRIDLNTGAVLDRFAVSAFPAGLVLWGDFLYVTHFWSGDLTLIYLPQKAVVRTIQTGSDTRLFQSMEIDTAQGVAYLPQSRGNAQTAQLTYDTAIWPVVNVVDLSRMTILNEARIALDTADRPVNMPFDALLDRGRLFVLNAGSNDLSVIDLASGLARAHVSVGANPRSLALSRDGAFLYVHNVIDGSISVVDTRSFAVRDVVPISNLTIPVDILIGAELFHSADDPRLSLNQWTSCASCHFDGLSDGQTWMGFPGGPRNTPLLFDLRNTAPYTWAGAWDELTDVELKIRYLMGGAGLTAGDGRGVHPGDSLDLDTLTGYLATLQGPPNPDTLDPALAARGAEVFQARNCATCHPGEQGTDLQKHDVDTGGEFDTPTLRWLWLSAPYFHDGSAATLRDVFLLPGTHQLVRDVPLDEIDALVAYLLSLP